MKRISCALGLLCTAVVVVGVSVSRGQSRPADVERWYSVLMENQPAGYVHHTVKHEKDRIITAEETLISIRRGAASLKIQMDSRFVETADHKPVECSLSQTLGVMAMKQKMKFNADGIETISEQNGREQVQKAPLPKEPWLTPAAAEEYAAKQLAAGVKEFSYATVSAEFGARVCEVKTTVIGRENVQVMGRTAPAIVCSSTMSAAPGVVTKDYVDESGDMLRSQITLMPGMSVTILAADKDLATRQINPPELLASSVVTPDRPIANARSLKRGVYELELTPLAAGAIDKPAELPQTPVQQMTWMDQNHLKIKVVVDTTSPQVDGKDAPGPDNLAASPMLDKDDPKVRELTEKAIKGKEKLATTQKAETLRKFVYGFISKKDFSVGLASASEVARTAEGDCTEHAVLLAALLRVAGIPSRTVSGMIYADQFAGKSGVFGYHMWTQAWLEEAGKGRWVDLDATLDGTAFDATHIALGISAMADASPTNDIVKTSSLIGRVKVKVVEAAGK